MSAMTTGRSGRPAVTKAAGRHPGVPRRLTVVRERPAVVRETLAGVPEGRAVARSAPAGLREGRAGAGESAAGARKGPAVRPVTMPPARAGEIRRRSVVTVGAPRGPVHRPVAPPGPGRRVRLTRRGRVVVVAVLVVMAVFMVVVLAWLAGASTARAAGGAAPPGSAYRNLTAVVVRPGQTLWSIASRAQPTADPRVVVQEIMDVNALPSMVIQAGERLWVPRG